MANIATENINTLAQLASSISDGDYIYIYKASSHSFARIEKSVFLQGVSQGFIDVIDNAQTDLDFADEQGNVIMRISGGHVKTKNFDSSDLPSGTTDLSGYYTKTEVDNLLDDIDVDVDLSNYYTKSQVESLVGGGVAETPKQNLKILFLGNSFTIDSISYLPFMLKNYGIDITIGATYFGGATINDYNTKYSSNSVQEYYLIDTSTDSNWTKYTSNTPTPQNAVKSQQWDMIVLQQGSSKSYTESNYSDVGTLVSKILADATNTNTNANANQDVIIGWNINHLGPDQFIVNNEDNGNREKVLSCCETVCENPNNHINFVFPYGTAIFDIMEKYSDMADYMTYTTIVSGQTARTRHLYEGFPCYAAALANMQALFERYYPWCSVMGDTYVPDTTHRIQPHPDTTSQVGMDNWSVDSKIAQLAACCANKMKYTLFKFS